MSFDTESAGSWSDEELANPLAEAVKVDLIKKIISLRCSPDYRSATGNWHLSKGTVYLDGSKAVLSRQHQHPDNSFTSFDVMSDSRLVFGFKQDRELATLAVCSEVLIDENDDTSSKGGTKTYQKVEIDSRGQFYWTGPSDYDNDAEFYVHEPIDGAAPDYIWGAVAALSQKLDNPQD